MMHEEEGLTEAELQEMAKTDPFVRMRLDVRDKGVDALLNGHGTWRRFEDLGVTES